MNKDYDSTNDTTVHIQNVQEYIYKIIHALWERSVHHDKSKLQSYEKPFLDIFTPKLKGCTYGSDEYKRYLKEMQVAIDHHYQNNRHHPEHFKYWECNGCFTKYKVNPLVCKMCGYSQFTERPNISGMNLIDIIEMFCDWMAATKRNTDGDIHKSIEINKDRFEMSDDLAEIFKNTIRDLNW